MSILCKGACARARGGWETHKAKCGYVAAIASMTSASTALSQWVTRSTAFVFSSTVETACEPRWMSSPACLASAMVNCRRSCRSASDSSGVVVVIEDMSNNCKSFGSGAGRGSGPYSLCCNVGCPPLLGSPHVNAYTTQGLSWSTQTNGILSESSANVDHQCGFNPQ